MDKQTILVHEGALRSQFGENSEALFLTQGYRYDSAQSALARFSGEEEGYIYARYANPTVDMFERRMAAYEGAETAIATASGMSAAFITLASLLRAGDHIVSARALFSSCLYIIEDILPKWGIEVTFVDGQDMEAWEKAIRPNTKVFFGESMSNPCLEVLDIASISRISKAHQITFVVDNVFVTPVCQKSLVLGADVIFYSATKHIDGQGRVMGGIVLGPRTILEEVIQPFFRHTGPTMSAFNAWVMLKSLETLELRVVRQSENALAIAQFLENKPGILRVLYPGLASHPDHALASKQMSYPGTMLAFEVEGGQDAAFAFLNRLKLIGLSNNLGDAKSLATHPATTTHYKLTEEQRLGMGIRRGLIRLSVGIEDIRDLLADLDGALSA